MRGIAFFFLGVLGVGAAGGLALAAHMFAWFEDCSQWEELSYKTDWPAGYPVSALSNAGEGKWRVVVVLGAPSRAKGWRQFILSTDKSREWIVVDRPGYSSGGPKGPVLDFEEQVAAVTPLLRDPSRTCVVALGTSYGAELALKATIEHPEHVDALVIMAGLMTEPTPFQVWAASLVELPGVHTIAPAWAKTAVAEMHGRRPQIGAVLDRAKEINVPVEIIHGTWDFIVPFSDSHVLESHLSEASAPNLLAIKRGSHYLFLDRPGEVRAAVDRAIKRAEARGDCAESP